MRHIKYFHLHQPRGTTMMQEDPNLRVQIQEGIPGFKAGPIIDSSTHTSIITHIEGTKSKQGGMTQIFGRRRCKTCLEGSKNSSPKKTITGRMHTKLSKNIMTPHGREITARATPPALLNCRTSSTKC